MKILVTGFDPFGGESLNPAWEAVKKIPDAINGVEVKKIMIPTVFNKSAEVTEQAIAEFQPDYVLNIGQAGGRFELTPERVAINVDDARIPDNKKISQSMLPSKKMEQQLISHNYPLKRW